MSQYLVGVQVNHKYIQTPTNHIAVSKSHGLSPVMGALISSTRFRELIFKKMKKAIGKQYPLSVDMIELFFSTILRKL